VELGGMDDGYRLYCEDIDLCWRMQEEGWSVDYLPDATVEHELSELTRGRFLTRATVWHVRSMLRFVRQHGWGRPLPRRTTLPLPAPTPVIDLRSPISLDTNGAVA
jgi:GT2 family glycosyltransferase